MHFLRTFANLYTISKRVLKLQALTDKQKEILESCVSAGMLPSLQ